MLAEHMRLLIPCLKLKMPYVNVLLPVPLQGSFTYVVPPAIAPESVRTGARVLVPFGSRHLYTGIVEATDVPAPQGLKAKEILSVLDTEPIIRHPQLRFWDWIANYYLCTRGEVYKAAVPAGLKIESETVVELSPEMETESLEGLGTAELAVVSYLREHGRQPVSNLSKNAGIPSGRSAEGIVAKLIDADIAIVSERLRERYRSVRKPFVRILVPRGDKGALTSAFALVKRSPKQEAALLTLMGLSGFNHPPTREMREVSLEELSEKADVTRAHVKALAERSLVEIYDKEISRFSYDGPEGGPLPALTDAQDKALHEIHRSFIDHAVTLLHGVTGSGKTEIYLHLIDYVLRQGNQVLYLVPEIALTTQLTKRLQNVFGRKVVIYHSKFSDAERVEIWRRLLHTNEPLVIIGARSAVFLPFAKLGLVIVDEEHESSYKQYDPAPRYNGRDAATVLASMHGAKTVYGSATPTIETYYKAKTGKFGLVELKERFGGAEMPEINIVDLRAERKAGRLHGDFFSTTLLKDINDTIGRGKQAILFHNRRGYAPMARCKMCQFIPKCDFCDVSLTYHRRLNMLQCHYCGASYPVPRVCPNCGEPAIEIVGLGTERLEDEIQSNFGNARVLRMDLDTTRNKDAYSRIIDEFSEHKADILVGTQMVTKGLDFANVELVGVLNADSLINFPDFRSSERAFNMLEQVGGRSGRRSGGDRGSVVVQTYTPDHPVLQFASHHDYTGFYEHELEERRAFAYPPFTRIINIYVKHRDASTAQSGAEAFAAELRAILGSRVSAVQEPPVSRIANLHIRKIMLKVEVDASMMKVKEILRSTYINLVASPTTRALTVYYDVDPV